jgi:hypothetical protein
MCRFALSAGMSAAAILARAAAKLPCKLSAVKVFSFP